MRAQRLKFHGIEDGESRFPRSQQLARFSFSLRYGVL
jgi:hypothetical protein